MSAMFAGVSAAFLVLAVATSEWQRRLRLRPLCVNTVVKKRSWVWLFLVPVSLVSPFLGAAIGLVMWMWPRVHRRREETLRRAQIIRDLPTTVDLLRLSVASGLNVSLAVGAVVEHLDGPLAEEFGRALDEIRFGRRIADALDDVPARTCDEVREIVLALTSSERYGSPLSSVLERLAHELRVDQGHRAEQAARRLTVQLLFPLAGCTLPAFALLTVAPLLVGSLGSPAFSFH